MNLQAQTLLKILNRKTTTDTLPEISGILYTLCTALRLGLALLLEPGDGSLLSRVFERREGRAE